MFLRSLAAVRSLSTIAASSSAVDSLILRSLKDHYLEVSKMTPPPRVNPPAPFTIIKGALDHDNTPVLRRQYNDEDITISVMRLANILPSGADDADDSIDQLFLHVNVAKGGRDEALHFLCGLYPDAIGIHSVSLRPKEVSKSRSADLAKYHGRVFQELDQKLKDGLHMFIEARGINEKLFRFLQAWLYVKDHRNLMQWFKSVGTFINGQKSA